MTARTSGGRFASPGIEHAPVTESPILSSRELFDDLTEMGLEPIIGLKGEISALVPGDTEPRIVRTCADIGRLRGDIGRLRGERPAFRTRAEILAHGAGRFAKKRAARHGR